MSETTSLQRQLGYWWAVVAALGDEAANERMTALMRGLVDDRDLPRSLLDRRASVRQVTRGEERLQGLLGLPASDEDDLDRQLLFLKSVLNVFGGNDGDTVSASDYNQWLQDVHAFEGALGYRPGGLLTGRGSRTGGGADPTDDDVDDALEEMTKGRGLLSEPEIQAGLQGIEKRLIDHMALAEVLADAKLARQITPSMAMVEQLLRQRGSLSGTALANAKRIIRRYVDELREVLARQVESATSGGIDYSTPPRRVFANLDLKRTIWTNLINYNPDDGRLYVDRLHYRHTTRKIQRHRMIVVVDQSGSMVPAMVNCTILASIFAGMPQVDAHLVAYDTQAIDLSDWVRDPFEVLLRTKLGGGTDGTCAIPEVNAMITDPRHTVLVWISDFYDDRDLLPWFRTLTQSGVTFLPVGSVSTSGYFSVDGWFRRELKQLGTPILSGSLKTLIGELKASLP